MARNDRQGRLLEVAVDQVEVLQTPQAVTLTST
jgi:hypothetical protein